MTEQQKRTLRFWDDVRVEHRREGYCILLDSRPVKLPGGSALVLQNSALANAIAQEWQMAGKGKRGETFDTSDIALTRIAGTMIERIAPSRNHTVETLADYAQTDLLCYRATSPELLVKRQHDAWSPILHWFSDCYAVSLAQTQGVMPVSQAPETVLRVRQIVASQSDGILAGLGVAVPALGSIVLGLALSDGRISPEQAAACATIDEKTQMELWGADTMQKASIASIERDVIDAARFMTLVSE